MQKQGKRLRADGEAFSEHTKKAWWTSAHQPEPPTSGYIVALLVSLPGGEGLEVLHAPPDTTSGFSTGATSTTGCEMLVQKTLSLMAHWLPLLKPLPMVLALCMIGL